MRTNKEKYEHYANILTQRQSELLSTLDIPKAVYVIDGNYRSGNFGIVECPVTGVHYDSADTWHSPNSPYTKEDVNRVKKLAENDYAPSPENVWVRYINGNWQSSFQYTDHESRGIYIDLDTANGKMTQLHKKYDLNPGDIHCTYCGKAFPEKDAINHEIFFRMNGGLQRKTNKYCSEQCGSYDQMAHEG